MSDSSNVISILPHLERRRAQPAPTEVAPRASARRLTSAFHRLTPPPRHEASFEDAIAARLAARVEACRPPEDDHPIADLLLQLRRKARKGTAEDDDYRKLYAEVARLAGVP